MKTCITCKLKETSRWWGGPTCNICAMAKKRRANGIPEKNNKEVVNFYTSIRRAQKKKAYPNWLSKEQKQLIIKQYKIAKELTEQTGIKYEVDYIIPLISDFVCGLHVPWNLQVIPSHENRIKSNKITHLNNETVT